MIDHRLTDREWAEEWKHLDHVRPQSSFGLNSFTSKGGELWRYCIFCYWKNECEYLKLDIGLVSKLMWKLLKRNISSWKSTDQQATVSLWKGNLSYNLKCSIFGKIDLLLGEYLSWSHPYLFFSPPPHFCWIWSIIESEFQIFPSKIFPPKSYINVSRKNIVCFTGLKPCVSLPILLSFFI